jgi:hypothetical protein
MDRKEIHHEFVSMMVPSCLKEMRVEVEMGKISVELAKPPRKTAAATRTTGRPVGRPRKAASPDINIADKVIDKEKTAAKTTARKVAKKVADALAAGGDDAAHEESMLPPVSITAELDTQKLPLQQTITAPLRVRLDVAAFAHRTFKVLNKRDHPVVSIESVCLAKEAIGEARYSELQMAPVPGRAGAFRSPTLLSTAQITELFCDTATTAVTLINALTPISAAWADGSVVTWSEVKDRLKVTSLVELVNTYRAVFDEEHAAAVAAMSAKDKGKGKGAGRKRKI